MKISELTEAALDWAVLSAMHGEDCAWYINHKGQFMEEHGEVSWVFQPSTFWHQGGPIIEREGIALLPREEGDWSATCEDGAWHGPTPLIAAMRCFVALRMGDTIEVPEGLQ
jgi:hypothetical protein